MTMLASTYTYGDYAMQVASGWAARMNSIPPLYRILRRPSHIRPRTLASAARSHTRSVQALTQPPRPPACLLRLLVPGSLCTGFMVGRRLPRPGRHGFLRRPGLGRQLLRGLPLFGRPCASCIPAPRPRARPSLQSLSLITSSLFLWHAIIACVPGLRWRSPVSALGIWLPCQGTPLACFRCISVRHNAAGFLTAWRADFLGAVARLGQQQRRRTRARVPGLPAAVETAKQQVILSFSPGNAWPSSPSTNASRSSTH